MFDLIKAYSGIVALVLVVLSMVTTSSNEILGNNVTTVGNPWTFEEVTGTSTVTVQSKASGKGGCIALEQNDGSGYVYIVGNSVGSVATTTTCD